MIFYQLRRFIILPLASIVLFSFPFPQPAQATTFSIESVGSSIGLGNADLKQTVIHILNLALGFLALIAVAMIIFSGIIAVTSSNEDRAATARRVISGAVIGLIIVLLAWAIVLFVARTTSNVTANT